jgi:predicted DNA-binding protein (MmcQ/YjbR family)
MTHKDLDQYLLSFPNSWIDYPFGEDTAVYKFGHDNDGKGKIFAIRAVSSSPIRVSLKTDPQLSETLRENYEEVQPGYHLNKRHWITVINSGQLSDDEINDLARLSYRLVSE